MDLDVMVGLSKLLKELDAAFQKKREAEDAPLQAEGAYEDATKKVHYPFEITLLLSLFTSQIKIVSRVIPLIKINQSKKNEKPV